MKKTYALTRIFLSGIALAVLLGGCSLWDRYFKTREEEKTPAQLMSEGTEKLDRRFYEEATQAFQKIKDRYPYSPFALEAELKMADAQFARELYDEAYEGYDEFEKLHPRNPNIPYVIYRKAMSHFNQVTTVDRDQSHTLQAKEEFERLVRKFPKSEYSLRAKRKIRECYLKIAGHELYVGHFYYKMKNYRAAIERYRYLLKTYPDLGQYDEALDYLARCKEKLAQEKKKKK